MTSLLIAENGWISFILLFWGAIALILSALQLIDAELKTQRAQKRPIFRQNYSLKYLINSFIPGTYLIMMRFAVLLLPFSTVILGRICTDILPRELDLFNDQYTVPIDDRLVQTSAPTDDWLAQSTEPADDWLLPPAEPFENFDIDQDTVSTELFDLPPSSISPLTELDLSSPFGSETLPSVTYSTISADQSPEEIAARKCANAARQRFLPRISQEERASTRFFDVPTRRCGSETRPFCTSPRMATVDPLGVSLRSAHDRMWPSLQKIVGEMKIKLMTVWPFNLQYTADNWGLWKLPLSSTSLGQ